MSAETIPCQYDLRRNCPQNCRLRNESTKWFMAVVDGRNKTNQSELTPAEVLEQLRNEAQIDHRLFTGGHVSVFRGEPKTLDCDERDGILSGISPF